LGQLSEKSSSFTDLSELRSLLRLSGPLVLALLVSQTMSIVDAAMVGRLGAASLAGVGVGNGLYFAITIFGLGLVGGMDTLVSQAVGAGETNEARRILRVCLHLAWGIGLLLTVALGLSGAILELAGVAPAVAAEARRFLLGRLLNVIPFCLFFALRSYLQALGVTRPIVLASIVANVLNIGGNFLLIFGDGTLRRIGLPPIGLPALGVFGCGLSSSFAMMASTLFLWLVVRVGDRRRPAAAPSPSQESELSLIRRVLRLGGPSGLQMVAEAGAFATAGLFAGRMGATPAAAHHIALSLASLSFMLGLGVSTATAVRVGRHIGAGQTPLARRAGLCGVGLSVSAMAVAGVLFLLFSHELARAFTDDVKVLPLAAQLITVAALFQLSDGTQVAASGALRGVGDTKTPLYANLFGYYVLGLPLAAWFGFSLGLGPKGVWWGLSAGLGVVAIWLLLRFLRVSRRPIGRA
jgi:MATE family multidrug resistance protein